MIPLDEWFRIHQPNLAKEIDISIEQWVKPEDDPEALSRAIKISVREAFLKVMNRDHLKEIEAYDTDLEWAMTLLNPNREKLMVLNQLVMDDINERRKYEQEDNESFTSQETVKDKA